MTNNVRRSARIHLFGYVLASVGLLSATYFVPREISYVLVVIAGMTVMNALSVASRLTEEVSRPRINLNENFLLASIETAVPQVVAERVSDVLLGSVRDEPTAADLLAIDKPLALAKLRIDIERQLREVALARDIVLGERPLGATAIALELARKEAIPRTLLEPIREVVDVCSRAIHGYEVTDDVARSVITVGLELLYALRAAAKLRA